MSKEAQAEETAGTRACVEVHTHREREESTASRGQGSRKVHGQQDLRFESRVRLVVRTQRLW